MSQTVEMTTRPAPTDDQVATIRTEPPHPRPGGKYGVEVIRNGSVFPGDSRSSCCNEGHATTEEAIAHGQSQVDSFHAMLEAKIGRAK